MRTCEGNILYGPLSHLIALPIVAVVWNWFSCRPLSFCIRWLLVIERLIRDDLSCSMSSRSKPPENAAVWKYRMTGTSPHFPDDNSTLCNYVATAMPASTRPPKYNNRQRRPIPQQTAAVRADQHTSAILIQFRVQHLNHYATADPQTWYYTGYWFHAKITACTEYKFVV